MNELVRKFKDARVRLGLTQAEVADGLHISSKAWSKIESGRNELRFEYVRPLCEMLGVPYLEALRAYMPVFWDFKYDLKRYRAGERFMLELPEEKDVFKCPGSKGPGMEISCVPKLMVSADEYAMYELMVDYFCLDRNNPEVAKFFGWLLDFRHRYYDYGIFHESEGNLT